MDFYKEIGVTPEGYKWMKEKDTMKIQTLYKIADVLHVKPEQLLQLESEDPKSGSDPGEKYILADEIMWEMLKTLKRQVEEIEKYLNQKIIIK